MIGQAPIFSQATTRPPAHSPLATIAKPKQFCVSISVKDFPIDIILPEVVVQNPSINWLPSNEKDALPNLPVSIAYKAFIYCANKIYALNCLSSMKLNLELIKDLCNTLNDNKLPTIETFDALFKHIGIDTTVSPKPSTNNDLMIQNCKHIFIYYRLALDILLASRTSSTKHLIDFKFYESFKNPYLEDPAFAYNLCVAYIVSNQQSKAEISLAKLNQFVVDNGFFSNKKQALTRAFERIKPPAQPSKESLTLERAQAHQKLRDINKQSTCMIS